MAKKSKAFRQLLSGQKRKQQSRQKTLNRLEKKVEQGPYPFDQLDPSPPGVAKMSDILKEFIEPFGHFAETEAATKKLLTMGLIAWNIALEPESEHRQMIDEILNNEIFKGDQEMQAVAKDIIRKLIDRKKQHFSECQRTIMDFELEPTGSGGYALSVASTFVQ